MGRKGQSRWALFGCFSKSAVHTQDDEGSQQPTQQSHQHAFQSIKPPSKDSPASGGSRQAMLFVRMASMSDMSSGGGDSSEGAASCSGGQSDIVEEEIWYECAEEQADWFDAAELSSSPASGTSADGQSAGSLTPDQSACLQDLPPQLRSLLTKYLLGVSAGCKPLVAIMRYMQDSNTSLAALQSLLQPLLDAEQHLPPQLPVLVPLMTPAERSAMLRRQMSQQHGAVLPAGCASSSSNSSGQNTCQQQCNNRTAHLLRNVQLLHETLSYMNQEEGFRQVATGPLSMWYCHDVAAESQLIRAKVVLEESVATITAVAREFDLVTSWNPGMADMRELANYSPTEVLVYLLPWMPWPLPQPEMVHYGFAADLLDLDQRCVLLHTSSAEAPTGIELPKHPRTMHMRMNVGGFRMTPLQPSADKPNTPRTEVTVLVSIDATRFVVPDNIISCMLKVFAPLVYNSVLKVFARMFHTAAAAAPSSSAAVGPQRSSQPVCSTSLLIERLGLRPEYAALDAHAQRSVAAAAALGPAQPLELYTPRTAQAGVVVA